MLDRVGGRILWHTRADQTVIGGSDERYDEVIAVWYPSRLAFLSLVGDPELLAARAHCVAALERATLICCDSGAEPSLGAH